jgi:aminoglycoside phosphotransferase (APT) family kinase protein
MNTPSQIETALATWATATLHKGVRVSNLTRLSGGASQETWAFDAQNGDARRPMILRRSPGGMGRAANSEAIGLATEAKLIGCARKADVPAPKVLGISAAGSALGEAFIMERVDGEALGRKILRDPEFESARGKLTVQTATALARIHAIPPAALPPLSVSNGIDQIVKYESIYRGFNLARPVFEVALAWLKAHPPQARPPVLVHGDFRLGNFLVNPAGLTAVLDWELAHVGDPREDIAWICVNSWRFGQSENRVGGFGQLDEFLAAYHRAGGTRFSAAEIDWWEILGSLKWGIMCMIMYESFRTSADPSVERAAIGRRVSETEIDLINLLERVAAHA